MAFFSEESLQNGFEGCKRNIVVITRFAIFLTIFVLVGISFGMIANKHYPLLATYALFVSIGMLIVELGLPVVARLDTSDQENATAWKARAAALNGWITPIKKCVIYAVAALPLFIHLSVAVLGALFLLISAVFLAGQVKYDDSEPQYRDLGEDDQQGPISGVSAGDVVLHGSSEPAVMVPSVEESSVKSDNDWELMKTADDVNLLLG